MPRYLPSRRTFLQGTAASVLALPASSLLTQSTLSQGEPNAALAPQDDRAEAQDSRQAHLEAAQAFFTSFYESKNESTAEDFLKQWLQSSADRYEDGTLGLRYQGFSQISSAFNEFIPTVANALGLGRFSRIVNVAGDLRYGAIIENVTLKNTFFATNGITVQTVFDLHNGLVVRDTDYWDSRELGLSDIVGPAATAGVAAPLAPVSPNGVPRTSAVAPPGEIALSTTATGSRSASPAMVEFVSAFHDTLRSGSARDIGTFFTEDALLIHPLLHQGPPLYGNYDQSIQIRGRESIVHFFQAVRDLLPDTRESTLTHVVGSLVGGGFEWKAGGLYNGTGLDRTGLAGCTSLNLYGQQITRMGVRFDTFQMPAKLYEATRLSLRLAGIVDAL